MKKLLSMALVLTMVFTSMPINVNAADSESKQMVAKEKIDSFDNQLQEKEGNITSLANQLQEKEGNITSLANQLQEKEGNITSLTNQLQEKEGNITWLTNQLQEKRGNITLLTKEFLEQQGNITLLKKKLLEQQGNITLLKKKLLGQQRNVTLLEEQRENNKYFLAAVIFNAGLVISNLTWMFDNCVSKSVLLAVEIGVFIIEVEIAAYILGLWNKEKLQNAWNIFF